MNRRNMLVYLAALGVLLLILAYPAIRLRGASSRLDAARAAHGSLSEVSAQIAPMSARISSLESRLSQGRARSVVDALDRLAEPLGIKDRLKNLSTLPGTDDKEEKASVTFEGVTINEAVNLMYDIKHSPMLLIPRKLSIKKSFSSPERLDVTLVISLIKDR